MQINETTLVIRPRNPWEAIDLGVRLATRHARVLLKSWALVTVPLYALLTLVLWNHPSVVFFIIWWLKPAFDRLPLLILSKALFGTAPQVAPALRQWLRVLRPQLLASLTWRRLSLSRSFTLPVQQLEELDGQARLRRLALLRANNRGAARWLTLAGTHLEWTLMLAALALLYALTPYAFVGDTNLRWLLSDVVNEARWLQHLQNGLYVLILLIWEPIYVACGFCLYLNRRTVLEAWDIELQFRRLRQRVSALASPSAVALGLIVLLTALVPTGEMAWADPASPLQAPLATRAPAPVAPVAPGNPVAGPQSPRLLNQALTSTAAREAARGILQAPPFRDMQTVSRWRWKNTESTEPDTAAALPRRPALGSDWLQTLAHSVEIILWALLIAAVALLTWRYKDWLGTFVIRLQRTPKKSTAEPALSHRPAMSDTALPEDLAATVEQLWATQPRQALSLLYRGLLWRLQRDHQLPFASADTEGQVMARIASLQQPELEAFSRRLTTHWQALAYGHQTVTVAQQRQLLADWRALFDAGARP